MTTRPRLAVRLMQAQALVIGVGGLTLIIAAVIVAPQLFHIHLIDSGVGDLESQLHAEEAFASSFAISVGVAVVAALLTAGAISWFLVRRVSRPVELLAQSCASRGCRQVRRRRARRRLQPRARPALHVLQRHGTPPCRDRGHARSTAGRPRPRVCAHRWRRSRPTSRAWRTGSCRPMPRPGASCWRRSNASVASQATSASRSGRGGARSRAAPGALGRGTPGLTCGGHGLLPAPPRQGRRAPDLTESHETLDVVVDAMRIEQVLANLLDNALFPHAGGRVGDRWRPPRSRRCPHRCVRYGRGHHRPRADDDLRALLPC